jgi:hypothetical protein
MTPETVTTLNLTFAFWVLGILSICGHLAKAVSDEPGTWGDFFRDKRNVTYLLISGTTGISMLITYAVTTGTNTVGAVLYAGAIGLAMGSASRAAIPSEVAKERKVEMKRAQAAHENVS